MKRRHFISLVTSSSIAMLLNLSPLFKKSMLVSLPSPKLKMNRFPDNLYGLLSIYEEKGINTLNVNSDVLSNLAWVMQGITDPVLMLRAAPSAGGLYPVDIYFNNSGFIHGLPEGLYKYIPEWHSLDKVSESSEIGHILLSLNYGRSASKYGVRGSRYTQLEAGHIICNLVCEAYGYGLIPKLLTITTNHMIGGDSVIILELARVSETSYSIDLDTSNGGWFEEIIFKRRSIRRYNKMKVPETILYDLLRLYSLYRAVMEKMLGHSDDILYLNIRNVEGYTPGLYKVMFDSHDIYLEYFGKDSIDYIIKSTFSLYGSHQEYIRYAPIQIVLSIGITKDMLLDNVKAGFLAEGIAISAVHLGLGCVTVGGFDDNYLDAVLSQSNRYNSKYIIPAGWPRSYG